MVDSAAESQLSANLDSNTLMEKLYGSTSGASAQQSMEISRIVETMCDFQVNELDFASFSELAPMADELVHYLTEHLDGKAFVPDAVTPSQVFSLVKFGVKFQIGEEQFWKFATSAFADNLTQMASDQILYTMTHLQE